MAGQLDAPSEPLEFAPSGWNATNIKQEFRRALDRIQPDHVIVTDSWNPLRQLWGFIRDPALRQSRRWFRVWPADREAARYRRLTPFRVGSWHDLIEWKARDEDLRQRFDN